MYCLQNQSVITVSVSDSEKTHGEPLPELEINELKADFEDFEKMLSAVRAVSDVPITFEEIKGGAKGYYNDNEKRITINAGMSQTQTLKTAIHELCHSKIHSQEVLEE